MLSAAGDLFFYHAFHPFYLFFQTAHLVTTLPGRMDAGPVAYSVVADQVPQALTIRGDIFVQALLPGRYQEEIISSQTTIQMQGIQPFISIEGVRLPALQHTYSFADL